MSHPAALTILHLLAPSRVGGLESVVRALGAGHRARGHRVHVTAVLEPQADRPPFLDALASAGVEVTELRLGARAYGAERAAVRALVARLAPDVVHCHGFRPDVLDAAIARRAGAAIVSTVHGFIGGGWRSRMYERLQERALRGFDAVVPVSRALVERLAARGVERRRMHLLPNALVQPAAPLDRAEARAILGIPAEARVAGFVGRLSREKGPDVLVEAAARVPGVQVHFVGHGRDHDALVALAGARALDQRVTFHGTLPDAGRLVRAFDVLVLSSRTEGTPITLLEAMAAGVPVVATRVGGIPDVVDERSARLVPPDDPVALAGAIAATLADPAAAAARAGAALDRLRRDYHPDAWLAAYERVYAAACERRGGAVRAA